MTEAEFAQLRPWHDGFVTDAGYKPATSLLRKGYLRHEFDAFYSLTAKAQREIAALTAKAQREIAALRGVPA